MDDVFLSYLESNPDAMALYNLVIQQPPEPPMRRLVSSKSNPALDTSQGSRTPSSGNPPPAPALSSSSGGGSTSSRIALPTRKSLRDLVTKSPAKKCASVGSTRDLKILETVSGKENQTNSMNSVYYTQRGESGFQRKDSLPISKNRKSDHRPPPRKYDSFSKKDFQDVVRPLARTGEESSESMPGPPSYIPVPPVSKMGRLHSEKNWDYQYIFKHMIDISDGIEFKTRTFRLRSYKHSILATEMVDWLILKNYTQSRSDAVEICQMLVDAKMIENSDRSSTFKDRSSVFTLTEEGKGLRNESANIYFWKVFDTKNGVPLKDKVWHLKLYKSSFSGDEFVNWFVKSTVISRDQAVRIANYFLENDLIETVIQDSGHFKDNSNLYQLTRRGVIRRMQPEPSKSELPQFHQKVLEMTPINIEQYENQKVELNSNIPKSSTQAEILKKSSQSQMTYQFTHSHSGYSSREPSKFRIVDNINNQEGLKHLTNYLMKTNRFLELDCLDFALEYSHLQNERNGKQKEAKYRELYCTYVSDTSPRSIDVPTSLLEGDNEEQQFYSIYLYALGTLEKIYDPPSQSLPTTYTSSFPSEVPSQHSTLSKLPHPPSASPSGAPLPRPSSSAPSSHLPPAPTPSSSAFPSTSPSSSALPTPPESPDLDFCYAVSSFKINYPTHTLNQRTTEALQIIKTFLSTPKGPLITLPTPSHLPLVLREAQGPTIPIDLFDKLVNGVVSSLTSSTRSESSHGSNNPKKEQNPSPCASQTPLEGAKKGRRLESVILRRYQKRGGIRVLLPGTLAELLSLASVKLNVAAYKLREGDTEAEIWDLGLLRSEIVWVLTEEEERTFA
eukprot:TRINITY_DN5527_c0_g1_i1.p1 TRINITY_DN5527_c0_g1~~TRINITY_DN5527_c0_g1_i1.p1  ORF type:complete len:842 (-),score=249.57 TRINITY_DN5527_c0_g1_i1:137-2662(-)